MYVTSGAVDTGKAESADTIVRAIGIADACSFVLTQAVAWLCGYKINK